MMKQILCALPLVFTLLTCAAQEKAQSSPAAVRPAPIPADTVKRPSTLDELLARARKRNGGKEPTKLDVYNELMHEAKVAAGEAMDAGKPRIVPRGARPEIIIKDSKVTYNGRELVLGAGLKEWESVLGASFRIDENNLSAVLVWDNFGFSVIVDKNGEWKDRVVQIKIYLSQVVIDTHLTNQSDGKPSPVLVAITPKKAFSGYLELDGFGIDAKTEFWEVRAAAKPSRKLRCGILDCSSPSGALGNDRGALYLDLNRSNDHGNIDKFTIHY